MASRPSSYSDPASSSSSSSFAASFESDGEWQALAGQLKHYRDWNLESAATQGPSDELIRSVAAFGARFQEKFVDFKHRLLQHLSAFKGTASIEVICERNQLKRELEADRLKLEEAERELAQLVAAKESTEATDEAAKARLNEQVEQAKVAILAAERQAEALRAEVAGLEEAAEAVNQAINERRMAWASEVMAPMVERQEKTLAEFVAASEALLEEGRAALAEKEVKLAALRGYNTRKKVVQKKLVTTVETTEEVEEEEEEVAGVAEVMAAVESISIE